MKGQVQLGGATTKERKKEIDKPNEGWGEDRVPTLHEQDFGRTIRDTGERERGAHRNTEGGWAGPRDSSLV